MTRPDVKRGTYLVIRCDGTREIVPERPTIKRVCKSIGCTTIDTVNLRDDLVMMVDDHGYETETVEHGAGHVELRPVRALKAVNQEATALYHSVCRPGTTHQIVGDVALVRDSDFA